MVMAQSLFMLLAQRVPRPLVDVLAPEWSAPLLARMPQVRQAIPLPLGHGALGLGLRHRIGRSLRAERYDQAIVLPNAFKSALIPFWARIPRRTGFVGELRYGLLNDARRLDARALPMTVLRFLALGLAPGAALPATIPPPALQVQPESVAQALAALGLHPPTLPVLALCPGAEYGPAKRWPVEHFAAVAQARLAAGSAVWLFGSHKDRPVTERLVELAPGCVDLAGRTSLGQALDLLSLATAVISNDSGLMHVAAALQRPLVAVYGSSDPGFTPPLGIDHEILRLGLDCSPCFQRECPLGHTRCLTDLAPSQVLAALGRLSR
jgi:heptosyltransferase-2